MTLSFTLLELFRARSGEFFFCPGIVIPDCGGLCYFEQLSICFDAVEVGSVDLLHEHLK
jgi:hypothetical protein